MNENGETGVLVAGPGGPVMLIGNLDGEVALDAGGGAGRPATDEERRLFFRSIYRQRSRATDLEDKLRSFAIGLLQDQDEARQEIGLELMQVLQTRYEKAPAADGRGSDRSGRV